MSGDKVEIKIARIETNVQYIREGLDELKNQFAENNTTHKDIYNKINTNNTESLKEFATKESIDKIWRFLYGMIIWALGQMAALIIMFFKYFLER